MTEENNKTWATPKILSDSPLRDTDEARFHFDEFAVTLARLIADPETRTPLTIGISGKWGSGKTTLLRRAQKLLDETNKRRKPSFANEDETKSSFRKCKTVWFDAWKYNDEDELLVALVRTILYKMQNGELKDKFKAFLGQDEIEPTYDFISMFINAFQFKFGGLGAEMQVKFDPEKHKEESPFKTHTSLFDYFDTAFENLLALWVHGKADYQKIKEKEGALVVFIDDLDRCLPAKAVQVLEAVKLFLDKDGCVFVLGADTRIVQDAITKHYDDAGIRDENVGDYIEKLIQLRFDLPPVHEDDMNAYVDEHVDDEALVEHWRIITAGAEANPRKVKTFLNDLRLRWAMWQNTGQEGDVDFDDFVRWEVLMRSAPKFRARVYGISDQQLRYELVEDAFKWAGGDDEV
jgi:tRNA A37 threonylcarbamoyladenosine biosynthesis protein TsaE